MTLKLSSVYVNCHCLVVLEQLIMFRQSRLKLEHCLKIILILIFHSRFWLCCNGSKKANLFHLADGLRQKPSLPSPRPRKSHAHAENSQEERRRETRFVRETYKKTHRNESFIANSTLNCCSFLQNHRTKSLSSCMEAHRLSRVVTRASTTRPLCPRQQPLQRPRPPRRVRNTASSLRVVTKNLMSKPRCFFLLLLLPTTTHLTSWIGSRLALEITTRDELEQSRADPLPAFTYMTPQPLPITD